MELAAPYLALITEQAPQRQYELREVFNALRRMARAGVPWRMMPGDFPLWESVYPQTRRWLDAGCFEAMVNDLRSVIRVTQGRNGSKVHMAVDAQRHLLAVDVTPANEQERAQVQQLCTAVQEATGQSVEVAWADQGYTGKDAKNQAAEQGIDLQIIKLPEAKKGFVLLPRRWVVERSFGWLARFRRLSRDYERLPQVLAGLHFLVFVLLMLPNALPWFATSMSS